MRDKMLLPKCLLGYMVNHLWITIYLSPWCAVCWEAVHCSVDRTSDDPLSSNVWMSLAKEGIRKKKKGIRNQSRTKKKFFIFFLAVVVSIKGLSSNKTNYPTATAFVILTNDCFLGPHPWCVNSLLLLPTLDYASSVLWVSLHSAHSLQTVHSLNSVFIKLTTPFECAICFWPENSIFLCPLLPLPFSH